MVEIIKINHNDNHWIFYLSNGDKHVIGKYKTYIDSNNELIEEGVLLESDAIDIVKKFIKDNG